MQTLLKAAISLAIIFVATGVGKKLPSLKGQIVLPKNVREAFGLKEGDRVRVEIEGDHVSFRRAQSRSERNWRRWRGYLSGTRAFCDHLTEHADEVRNERVP